MRNSMFGVRAVLESITRIPELKLLFDQCTYTIGDDIDWDASKSRRIESTLSSLKTAQGKHLEEYSAIVTRLRELYDVCVNRDSPARIARLNGGETRRRLAAAMNGETVNIHDDALWICLNEPESWAMLLSAARSIGGSRMKCHAYRAEPGRECRDERIDEMESAFSHILVDSTMHGSKVRIFRDTLDDRVQYVICAKCYQTDVPQFSRDDEWNIDRDLNAINYLIEYEPDTGAITLRADLPVRVRDALVSTFADMVLGCTVEARVAKQYRIERTLEQHEILNTPSRCGIVGFHLEELSVRYTDDRGFENWLTLGTDGIDDVRTSMTTCLSAMNISADLTKISSARYEVKYADADRFSYCHATVTKDGISVSTRNRKLKAEIIRYLENLLK